MTTRQSKYGRIILLLTIAAMIAAFFIFDLNHYLSFEFLKAKQAELKSLYDATPLKFSLLFALVYIAATALSVPGATVLTLAAGFIFGFWRGLVLVSFASTIGATLSFLISRLILSDFVARHFAERLKKINAGFEKEGAFYLLTLRLVPVFPFFLVNLTLGLTKIRVLTFAFVSQIGMIPGTAAYVNAGTQLGQINSLKGILSPTILLSFTVIGILPLIAKAAIGHFKDRKNRKHYPKPKLFEYNMVVIGGGSAGLVSSYIASAIHAKVALIEKHKMGGDCLNTGCVPSKALIRSAKIASYLRRSKEFGIDSNKVTIDFAKVMERVANVIKQIEPHDSIARYQSLGVECIQGEAKIVSPFEVQVGERVLTTKNIIVATGARPLVPAIEGLNEVGYLTSDTVWSLRERPQRLVILGGGPIGCELAQAFSRLGSSVSLIEMSSRILIKEDPEVSLLISEAFKNEGIQVLTAHKAVKFRKDSNGKFLICENEGKDVRFNFDQVLIALGRSPNTSGFGLEELDVKLSEQGTINVNEFMQTNYPNIYACGDVAGPFQFTHTAAHQAWYAAANALFRPFKKFKVDYRVIPWCTFVEPEVARVGVSETEAREQKLEFEITKYEMSDLDRAITEGEDRGFVKVITQKGSDKILGATIVGDHAGDIISEYVAAMKHGIGLKKILSTIHIYPTLAEANKYAAGVWQQNHKPEFALKLLKWFHNWRL